VKRPLIVISLLIVTSVVVSVIAASNRQLQDTTSHSTFSTDHGGTAALLRLVEAMGYAASQSSVDPAKLDPRPGAVVVIPAAPARGMVPQLPDMAKLVQLAKSGVGVVVFGADGMTEELPDIDLAIAAGSSRPNVANRALKGLVGFDRLSKSRLTLSDSAWLPLLAEGQKTYAAARAYGPGLIVVVASAEDFDNRHLGEPGRAALAMRLIGLAASKPTVAFDETIHGYGEGGDFWEQLGAPFRVLAWQLAILFVVIVYSVGKRFGYPRLTRPTAPTVGEHIEAMATLYDRGQASGMAMDAIRRGAVRRLMARYHVDETRLADRIPSSLVDTLSQMRPGLNEIRREEAIRLTRKLDAELEALRPLDG